MEIAFAPEMGGMFNPAQSVGGVTVTAYISAPTWGGWIPWPAHIYGQTNPQVTDNLYPDGITTTGYYAFYTPPGLYYLTRTSRSQKRTQSFTEVAQRTLRKTKIGSGEVVSNGDGGISVAIT